jgi:hypothetical protein
VAIPALPDPRHCNYGDYWGTEEGVVPDIMVSELLGESSTVSAASANGAEAIPPDWPPISRRCTCLSGNAYWLAAAGDEAKGTGLWQDTNNSLQQRSTWMITE